MLTTWRALRPIVPCRAALSHHRHIRHIADLRPFIPGDSVLLRRKDDRTAPPLLIPTLTLSAKLDTHKGVIHHSDIIGKSVRSLIESKPVHSTRKGAEWRLHEARLDDYVRLRRRMVTPLYPQDAQLIVGILDLHPDPPSPTSTADDETPKLEILEAGTGHGALTLYLSRTIHAANPPRPHPPVAENCSDQGDDDSARSAYQEALSSWKATRRALIHSIELSPAYSAHASKLIHAFRHGQYASNIDFHIGDVSAWILATLPSRNNLPFLSHALLDLPGSDAHLATVTSALRTDGALVVFNPSISQIVECVATVRKDSIPLELERVVELGVSGGSGGREWDVRAVRPRAVVKMAGNAAPAIDADDAGSEEQEGNGGQRGGEGLTTTMENSSPVAPTTTSQALSEGDGGWKMVCRPKVGEMIVGGGFVAVFRKQREG